MNWLRSKLLKFLFKEPVTLKLQDDTAVHILTLGKTQSNMPYVKYRIPSSELKCKIR